AIVGDEPRKEAPASLVHFFQGPFWACSWNLGGSLNRLFEGVFPCSANPKLLLSFFTSHGSSVTCFNMSRYLLI
ncbi:hypothetical protein, partial [Hydrogenispora ethanolica]|uniref:hypothetical protein n=1 Tax=Hydrogenispora ethanolica TaxID=1082276 RepID=UPI001A9F0546